MQNDIFMRIPLVTIYEIVIIETFEGEFLRNSTAFNKNISNHFDMNLYKQC